jgi:hypothetical protein
MMWICSGTPAGQPPNSSGGTQEWKSAAAVAPGPLLGERLRRQHPEREADVRERVRQALRGGDAARDHGAEADLARVRDALVERLEGAAVVEVRHVHGVARGGHPLAEGAHARRQPLRMVEDQQLGHPGSVCRIPEGSSDVPGDTHREEHLVKYVILIHSNPRPWGHPTADYVPEFQSLPRGGARAMHADFERRSASSPSAASCSAARRWATPPRRGCTAGRTGAARHRRALLRGQGAPRRLLPDRRREPGARRGDRRAVREPGRHGRAAATMWPGGDEG